MHICCSNVWNDPEFETTPNHLEKVQIIPTFPSSSACEMKSSARWPRLRLHHALISALDAIDLSDPIGPKHVDDFANNAWRSLSKMQPWCCPKWDQISISRQFHKKNVILEVNRPLDMGRPYVQTPTWRLSAADAKKDVLLVESGQTCWW